MANALCDIYLDYATFHTAIETVDETKVIAAFATNENGKTKYVIVKKT
jgi:hypothetical protein